MGTRSIARRVLFTFICLFGLASRAVPTEPVWDALFSGPPKLATSNLDPAAYVTEKIQKLANPQIAYINWKALDDIFLKLGYETLPRDLTPELAKSILNYIGYAKRVDGESAEAFINEFREVYSIRYGGRWINYNFGAGRNGASGLVDTKGIGRTMLVRPWANGSHSSGIAGLPEAMKEAFWSNILHEELPYGANRVLFILTTGTLAIPDDPNSDARALMVREDSNRPAYFQPNEGVFSNMMSEELRQMHTKADQLRIEKLTARLIENLPKPNNLYGSFTPSQVLRMGFLELIDRAAYQYATAFTRQIILAGISTSNIEIDGRAIDYGVTSALIGFPKASFSDSESPHGTTGSLKSDLFLELAEDYKQVLPAHLKNAIPSPAEIAERIDTQFALRVRQGLLELAGTPKEYSEKAMQTEQGRAFADTLVKIIEAGNEKIHLPANGRLVGRTGTYNLERILNELVRMNYSNEADQSEMAKALRNKELRNELLQNASAHQKNLEAVVKKDGMTAANLSRYAQIAVKSLNKSFYSLRDRPALWKKIREVAAMLTSQNDSLAVQKWIDQTSERNIHRFRTKELQIGVPEGKAERAIFNLKTGVYQSSKDAVIRSCKSLFN